MCISLHRLKSTPWLRELCAETNFSIGQLIQPLFVIEGLNERQELSNLKGVYRETLESALQQVEDDLKQGVRQFILFNVPQHKRDRDFQVDVTAQALREMTKRFGSDLHMWVDTCLCSFTSTGHCCLFDDHKNIDLKASVASLSKIALSYAQAGAQGIAPSDMMDGSTAAIRQTLDKNGYEHLPIMSYSTKFASHFYGPFREATDSAPQFGDRCQYQLDVRDRSHALLASQRCANEGADLLMVKPGLTSIDLLNPIKKATSRQVGAYQVSGEYGALHLLAREKLIYFEGALWESWQVFKRAGAQFIITYGARYARAIWDNLK